MRNFTCLLSFLLTLVAAELPSSGLPRYASNCGARTLNSVSVSECEDQVEQCQVRIDANMIVNVTFTPHLESQTLKRYVAFENYEGWIQYEQKDSCSETGLTCPLPAGKVAFFSETANLTTMPKGAYPVEWSIHNEKHEELACVQLALIFV